MIFHDSCGRGTLHGTCGDRRPIDRPSAYPEPDTHLRLQPLSDPLRTPGLQGTAVRPLVLIASGDEWWLQSLESVLTSCGYPVAKASTGRRALELRRQLQPGAFLLESDLPDMHGVDLCRYLRAEPGFDAAVPVLLLYPEPQPREVRVRAMQAGAWACPIWPLDAEECLTRLATYTAAYAETARARADALFDSAAGALSTCALLGSAGRVLALARRASRPVGAVVLSTADTLPGTGPEPAEEFERRVRATRRLARFLEVTIRLSDVIGMLSPTEIAIVTPDTGAEGCARMAERILGAVDSIDTPAVPGHRHGAFRVLAGYYAPVDPCEVSEAVTLLARARLAVQSIRHWDSGRRVASYSDAGGVPGGTS